ncbi:MAG: leucine-rich repeat protein, partial [Bacteroidales bacterium]|nr:leucine-rich repeat protein [Bacteroidales bacterium]
DCFVFTCFDFVFLSQNLKSINFPESVDSIGFQAFSGCSSLTAITWPSKIKSISKNVFSHCSNLTSVNIPEGVESIEEYAFWDCERLSKLTLPESLKKIGYSAFSYCESLSKITIPEGISEISGNTFSSCNSLVSVSLPQSLTKIGRWAFSYCVSLKSIDIPEGVTSIGGYAFIECEDLSSIEIPQGVTVIDETTFCDCVSLTSITIPAGVTSIEREAFYGCENLTDLVFLGNKVTYVGAMALRDCDALKAVHVPTGAYANYTDLLSLYEPNVVEDVVIIGATGYATACSRTSALDFSSAEIEAYVASVTEDGTSVALHKTHKTAVGEGFVVKGAEGSYLIPTASSETAANQVNTLVGTTEDATLTSGGDSTYYYMAALTSGNVGFTKLESGSVVIPAGQAYLSAAVSVAELEFVVGEDLTAIKNVRLTDEAKGNGTWHTLSGLTVTKPTKGLYIHNGKKVYVR